jgi:sugar lactone lactonase YvrE
VNATIATPTGLAFSRGRLFVSESGTHSVRAIELSSGTISTVAGSLAQGFAGDGGPALLARLSNPRALTVSADGNTLFIADRDNHRVRALNLAAGTIRTFSGTGATQFNGSRQPAGDAALRNPGGLWASARGFLFIADTGHQVVWRATLGL